MTTAMKMSDGFVPQSGLKIHVALQKPSFSTESDEFQSLLNSLSHCKLVFTKLLKCCFKKRFITCTTLPRTTMLLFRIQYKIICMSQINLNSHHDVSPQLRNCQELDALNDAGIRVHFYILVKLKFSSLYIS